MVLGLVREAQGLINEAEALLREAVRVISGAQFVGWEERQAIAEFLLRQGRAVEGNEALAAARAEVATFGPDSPIYGFLERRAAAAREAGAAADAGSR
jgi:hypothetical protein